MNKEQTELLEFVVNPRFTELIKQPIACVRISSYFSFDMERNGQVVHCTIYGGKDGQVNISRVDKHGILRNIIITDYCKTPEDFKNLIEKLDDLLIRTPTDD